MKSMKCLLAAAAVLLAAACGPKKADAPKVLVLYYSQTENTQTVAQTIATALGADMEAILPIVPYDGTYQETIARGMEERQAGILPEIQPINANVADYDVIFLGYPIWYGTYALPIATLLDQVDLSGKKVVPFCTFGSGGLDSSVKDLAAKQPGAEILPGYGVRAARMAAVPAEVDRFLKAGGFVKGDVVKLDEFPAPHAVTEEEAAIFDAAVSTYPMINATATEVTSRPVPGGVEYIFTAQDKPREGMPMPPGMAPRDMKVYVIAEEGKAPEFTQVVR